jgi:hypothetical protein
MVSANSVGEPVTAQPKPFAAAIAVLVPIEMETEDDTSQITRLGASGLAQVRI